MPKVPKTLVSEFLRFPNRIIDMTLGLVDHVAVGEVVDRAVELAEEMTAGGMLHLPIIWSLVNDQS
jgi:hypothetical protein